jgi:hypothetical protein
MKNKKEHKKLKPAVVIASAIIVLGVIFSVLYFTGVLNRHERFSGNFHGNEMNFQFNESQISEVNSFFNANPSLEETQVYCKENRNLCFYYCKNLQDSDLCKQVMDFNKNDSIIGQSSGATNG